jgi:hypothetical protein
MQIPFVVHVVEPRISGTFHLAAAPDAITKAIAMECEGRVFITDPIGDTFVRTEFSELTDGGRGVNLKRLNKLRYFRFSETIPRAIPRCDLKSPKPVPRVTILSAKVSFDLGRRIGVRFRDRSAFAADAPDVDQSGDGEPEQLPGGHDD